MTVKKFSQVFACFTIACLTTLVGSKLTIEGPEPLAYVFDKSNGEINAQYANFGHIPYGQTLVSISILFIWLLTKICAFLDGKNNMGSWEPIGVQPHE